METHSRTLLKFLFCGCITILMNGDGFHTWFHSFSPLHGFAFPHCSFLCLTQDLEGVIYCFLQTHPVFLATNLRLISRHKWGIQTATPALHVAFQQVQMLMLAHIISRCVSHPQLCVGHETVSPNNLLILLCSTFSLGCSSGKLQGYSWNSIPQPALSVLPIALLPPHGTIPVDSSALSLERFQLWHFSCWFFRAWDREVHTSLIFSFVCWILWVLFQKEPNNSMSVYQVFLCLSSFWLSDCCERRVFGNEVNH